MIAIPRLETIVSEVARHAVGVCLSCLADRTMIARVIAAAVVRLGQTVHIAATQGVFGRAAESIISCESDGVQIRVQHGVR